jgi:sugar/nucleoside kinase (ribokinase family)
VAAEVKKSMGARGSGTRLADGLLDAALLARYEVVARPEALRWANAAAALSTQAHGAVTAMPTAVQVQTWLEQP